MTCGEFEFNLREVARGQASAAHAEACAGCARKLEAERRLSAALNDLAAEPADAPEYLEGGLAMSFRGQRRNGSARYWWAGAAIAAGALIAALLPAGSREIPAQVQPATSVQRVEPAHVPALEAKPAQRPQQRRYYASRPADRRSMDGRGFIPVLYGADIPASGQVIRVSLPRTALVSFGLPVNEFRSADRVQADVLIGDDGLARAVRFRQ